MWQTDYQSTKQTGANKGVKNYKISVRTVIPGVNQWYRNAALEDNIYKYHQARPPWMGSKLAEPKKRKSSSKKKKKSRSLDID